MLWKRNNKQDTNRITKHKKVKVGFAFGGGGVRGIALIGVLRAFEDLGLKADFVAGTSIGSVIGALYSAGFSSSQMLEMMNGLREKDIRNSKVIWKPSKSENIEQVLKDAFNKDLMFSELNIPLTVVACDIKTGEQANITSGSVAKACSGSCAVPGVFLPVIYEDMHLVDGGLHNNVPADVVRFMGADVVIAIDLNSGRGDGTDSLKLMDVLKASLGIMMQANVEKKLEYADLVINPELKRFSSTKLKDVDDMIEIGYRVIMEHRQQIIDVVKKRQKRKIRTLWHKLKLEREKQNKTQ